MRSKAVVLIKSNKLTPQIKMNQSESKNFEQTEPSEHTHLLTESFCDAADQPQDRSEFMSSEQSIDKDNQDNDQINEIQSNEQISESKDSDSSKEGQERKEHSKQVIAFMQELEKISDPEAKLHATITFMEQTLAQSGTPHFKNFWDARNICIALFKENIAPAVRTILWSKYTDLSKEARRLKEILDEQSAFAVEQINIAIQALETEIAQADQQNLHSVSDSLFQQLQDCKAIENSKAFYENTQAELDVLNNQASRINALRKELIKTEMRVRHKNKFFHSLSAAGDSVFPKRKDLIQKISQQFIEDIDGFISTHFTENSIEENPFFLREEIKSLQGLAKLLTLNTHAFTHTRMRLSECWDKLKHVEKERKKVRAQQKTVFKQNADLVLQKFEEFKQTFESGKMSIADASKMLDDIVSFMRNVELGRDELKYLRDDLQHARQLLLEKVKTEEKIRQDHENERQRAKQQKFLELKQSVDALLQSADSLSLEQLIADRDTLLDKIQTSSLIKSEKQELERSIKSLRDVISDKKEQALLAMPDDARQSLQQMREILQQRKERRQELKTQLEALRRASGSSGLGFEQAMGYTAQLNAEKERLEKINQAIEEAEQNIAQLERKSK